jgi:HlyD family secretion protein
MDGANYYEAKIRLDTKGRRIPTGLNADADIETQRLDGIRVPSQSVLGRPTDQLPAEVRTAAEVEKDKASASVVYRYADGKAVVTPVKVGPSNETHTLVLSGLKEGEPVISGPYKALDTLQHGNPVTKEDVPPKALPATKPAGTQPTTVPATQPTSRPAGGMTKLE